MRILTIAFFAIFMLAPAAFAQYGGNVNNPYGGNSTANTQGTSQSVQLTNPLNTGSTNCSSSATCLSGFLASILDFVVNIGTVVIILMLVYVGYLFVVARGVPGKIEEARKALFWTVVGALILLGAKTIALGIQATVQAISVGK